MQRSAKAECICGRTEYCGPRDVAAILGATAVEGGRGQIAKGLVCLMEESELYPIGCWEIAEVSEQAVL